MKISTGFLTASLIMTPLNASAQTIFALEDFFKGESIAKGSFKAINGTIRNFDVKLYGEFDGKTLKLREDFVFENGETDTKTWVFEKISENKYLGSREDVIGQTEVTIEGNKANFTYLVYLDGKNKKMKVRFHDEMILQSPNKLINNAKVTKWGIKIADTMVEFEK